MHILTAITLFNLTVHFDNHENWEVKRGYLYVSCGILKHSLDIKVTPVKMLPTYVFHGSISV